MGARVETPPQSQAISMLLLVCVMLTAAPLNVTIFLVLARSRLVSLKGHLAQDSGIGQLLALLRAAVVMPLLK